MTKKTLLIGITGGIGTGKSTICKIFGVLGIPVYEADTRARWLMNHQPELIEKIKSNFGNESYNSSNELDRAYLASKVFNDGDKVKILNSLVHPAVGMDFLNWAKEQKDAPYILNEAALTFESGNYKNLDKVMMVSAPKELKIKRVLQRDPQRGEKEIESIIEKQMPDEEKILKADYVIYNDEKQLLIPQVLAIHQALLGLGVESSL